MSQMIIWRNFVVYDYIIYAFEFRICHKVFCTCSFGYMIFVWVSVCWNVRCYWINLCILTVIVFKCNLNIMEGHLQLTLAIIKPHVTRVPHALQVRVVSVIIPMRWYQNFREVSRSLLRVWIVCRKFGMWYSPMAFMWCRGNPH